MIASTPTNPFAASRIRPGTLPFLFPGEGTVTDLIGNLQQQRQRGQIVGAHGSGKSTLLCMLCQELDAQGVRVRLIRLNNERRRCPRGTLRWMLQRRVDGRQSIVLLDGFEQLMPWERWTLRLVSQWSGVGLVVTAHHQQGLPDLYRTAVTPQIGEAVVRQLLAHQQVPPGESQHGDWDIGCRLGRHAGNLREVLFELYDEFTAS